MSQRRGCGGRVGVAVRKCPQLLVLDWLEEFFPQNICGGADCASEAPPPVAGVQCPWNILGAVGAFAGCFPRGAGLERPSGQEGGNCACAVLLEVRVPGQSERWSQGLPQRAGAAAVGAEVSLPGWGRGQGAALGRFRLLQL